MTLVFMLALLAADPGQVAVRATGTLAASGGVLGATPADSGAKGSAALLVVVLDSTGGRVAGAKVTLSQGGRRGRTQATGAAGDAPFVGLSPGTYAVHVEARGFDPADRADVAVDSVDSRVEVMLERAHPSEDMNVSVYLQDY